MQHFTQQQYRPSNHSSVDSSTCTTECTSPTSSLRSCSSASSDLSVDEATYRELQKDNHELRKRHRQDQQRTAIILEQYRQEERAVSKMQSKIEDLQAALEEANAKLLDVLEENHSMRQSLLQARKSSSTPSRQPSKASTWSSPSTTTPKPRELIPQRRETFLEDSPLDSDSTSSMTSCCISELEDTSAPQPPTSTDTFDTSFTPTPRPKKSHSHRNLEPASTYPLEVLPLAPLTPPPTDRRDAISATQDSYLARSLFEMSLRASSSHSGDLRRHRTTPREQSSGALAPKSSVSTLGEQENILVPCTLSGSLTSAKRLPKSSGDKRAVTRACLTGPVMMPVMS